MSRPSLTPSDKKLGRGVWVGGACREFKEIREIKEIKGFRVIKEFNEVKEIKEFGVGGYFSLISLNSLNSLTFLSSLHSLHFLSSLNSQSFSPLTILVKMWWLLCIVKQNDKPKTTTTMKLNYTIDCRHCGTHTEYSVNSYYATLCDAEFIGNMHIDTECAMRCPACRYRLNTTEADFLAQVHITREA